MDNCGFCEVTSNSVVTPHPFAMAMIEDILKCKLSDYESIINVEILANSNMTFCCDCVELARERDYKGKLNNYYEAYVLRWHNWYIDTITQMLFKQLKNANRRNLERFAIGCAIKKQNFLLECLAPFIRFKDDVVCLIKKYNYKPEERCLRE
ncbi:unnamed protein product [Cylicocyclus nassatus]|uniref:Uncharacterized protein n=1 Tax=Cylicocyclus nassatus TaxID=53992 RepID=A0AA36DKK1_CYLNA|nr:unnamed protein product [Cylicocyclus nassatus]